MNTPGSQRLTSNANAAFIAPSFYNGTMNKIMLLGSAAKQLVNDIQTHRKPRQFHPGHKNPKSANNSFG